MAAEVAWGESFHADAELGGWGGYYIVRTTGTRVWSIGSHRVHRALGSICVAAALHVLAPAVSRAQVATVGAGALITNSSVNPVAEAYIGAPPVYGFRAYGIGSWTDDSWAPTLVTAVERVLLPTRYSFTTLGAGLVWLEFNDYRPYPILTSTTVVPFPVPAPVSLVVVGSTQPFQDCEWTIVAKLAVTAFFVK